MFRISEKTSSIWRKTDRLQGLQSWCPAGRSSWWPGRRKSGRKEGDEREGGRKEGRASVKGTRGSVKGRKEGNQRRFGRKEEDMRESGWKDVDRRDLGIILHCTALCI